MFQEDTASPFSSSARRTIINMFVPARGQPCFINSVGWLGGGGGEAYSVVACLGNSTIDNACIRFDTERSLVVGGGVVLTGDMLLVSIV